jgi:peptide/nickel transport system substrate-binding protein
VRKMLCLLVVLLTGALAQTLNIGLDVDPGTMDPRLARDTSAFRMQELVFNGLTRLDPKLKPVPDLAVSWRYLSPTLLEVKLRPNVVFHDGKPFTSEDVVYTYTTVLDARFNSPNRALYTPITKIEAPDALTVRFTLSEAFAPLLAYLNMGIVSKEAATRSGADFGTQPVGTGPFRLVRWQKGSLIELAANERYFRGKPKLERLLIRPIPDNNVRLLALESGDLQFIHSPVPPQEVDRLSKSNQIQVTKTNALGITYLGLNTRDPILSDRRVRQALAYLTNKDTISKQIFFGMDTPGRSFLLPGSDYTSNKGVDYDLDTTKADQLLTAAGWVAPRAGAVRQKGGQPLTIEIVTNIDPNRQQVLEYLQGEWRKAGIDVKIRVYDFAAMLNDLLAGKFQITLVGLLNLTDPDRAAYRMFKTNGSNNYGKYSSSVVDTLLEDARLTNNLSLRRSLYGQIAQTITEDVPVIFLLYQGYVVMHDRRLKGFVVHPAASWYSLESASF